MSKLSNTIKALRIRKGMTQEELAKVLKISRSSIGMYESGERTPGYEILEKYADYFNVDMNYIYGIETDEDYYLSLQSKQIAQEILDNPNLKALFDASRGATPADLEITRNLLLSLKKKEQKGEE